jgi:hypothetical protein
VTVSVPARNDLYRRFEGYEELKPLLDGSDEEVLLRLAKPTLIRIPAIGGEAGNRARFVSCLLHGNEDSGYRAVLHLLRQGPRFHFDLWVFIGNVRAASHEGWFAHRFLEDQEDFNRVWGVSEATTRMRRCAAAVLEELRACPLEAAIDLHNNTGDNPYHAITPNPTPDGLHLAAMCADTVLIWNLRAYTLMEALTGVCPAVAVECGLPGLAENSRFAGDVLDTFLSSDDLHAGTRRPTELYDMLHRVVVRPEVPFAFGGVLTDELDLVLTPGLDGQNFGMLLAGTELGHVHPTAAMPLEATDMHGRDVTDDFFKVDHRGRLVTTQDITPIMMVTTVVQARRDCLFYIGRRRASA